MLGCWLRLILIVVVDAYQYVTAHCIVYLLWMALIICTDYNYN